MRISKIRDLALTALIIMCLMILITWLNQPKDGARQSRTDDIAGRVQIIDADSFFIGKNEIRLYGVDAPEGKQYCKNKNGTDYPCGRTSTKALKHYVAKDKITCTVKTWDRYNRAVSVCYKAGIDLNDWVVRNGHALAYRKYTGDYVAAENEAKAAHRGMWQGTFLAPWQWRHIHR